MSYQRESTHTARKEYLCDSYEQHISRLCRDQHLDFSLDDQEALKNIEKDNGKILKGMKYVKIVGTSDGKWYVLRARVDCHNICINNDFYNEW